MADAAPKNEGKPTKRKPQGPRKERPIFVAMQILGDDGQPMQIAKDRVVLIKSTKDASELLDIMDSGNYPASFYKKVSLEG